MQWIKEIRPCPVCSGDSFVDLGTRGGGSHRDRLGEETNVVRCRECTAIYARPTMIPVGNPYETEEGYFDVHDPEEVAYFSNVIVEAAESQFGGVGRMLEVGCGRGIALEVARTRGWTVAGVEMTEQFAKEAQARGLPVELASVENCRSLDEKYDVIIMGAVLEHLYKPVEVLSRISNALNPGGLLFIDAPNEQSLTYLIGNLYVRPWTMHLSPTFSPYHVVGFSPTSITRAVELSGLRVKQLIQVSYGNSLPGGSLKRSLERAAMGAVQFLGKLVGRSDGLIVWAEKPR